MNQQRSVLQAVGSLWLAAVILLSIMLVMGTATVYELEHDTQQMLDHIYGSAWFGVLAALFAINTIAALVSRWPYNVKQLGFLVTHASLLLIFVGAWTTKLISTEGQIALVDGQSTDHYVVAGDMLTVDQMGGVGRGAVDLAPFIKDQKDVSVELDDLVVTVDGYAADSRVRSEVVEDATGQPAVEVVLEMKGREDSLWVFATGGRPSPRSMVSYRVVADAEELKTLLSPAAESQPASIGSVEVTIAGKVHELSVEDCMSQAAPVADTGYSLRVLRYLPDATVRKGEGVVSASDQPNNPAIRYELTSGAEPTQGWAFSNHPDMSMSAMHGAATADAVKVVFKSTGKPTTKAATPVEVIAVVDGPMFVRFSNPGTDEVVKPVSIGESIETLWSETKFSVKQRFARAKEVDRVDPFETAQPGGNPQPAIRVTAKKGEVEGEPQTLWIQKYVPSRIPVDGKMYTLRYAEINVPLGYTVKLNHFRIGRYPGLMMPRTFESNVTITDPKTGDESTRVISMNHPHKQGRYTLFQSSFRERQGQSPVTILSVTNDPGQIIVFIGYVAMVVGMVWSVATRIGKQADGTDPAKGGAA